MINLIPRSAKKKLLIEYWIRAVSVWGVLWASALALGVAALVPAYVLVSQQVEIYAASAASASEKVAAYEDVSGQLRTANIQSREVVDSLRLPQFSEHISIIRSLEGPEITINTIGMRRSEDGQLLPIIITGMAANRLSLATFRDKLLAEDWVGTVDLPISNLAQDRDITFSITVTVESEKPYE